jgi:hypothetical protein
LYIHQAFTSSHLSLHVFHFTITFLHILDPLPFVPM